MQDLQISQFALMLSHSSTVTYLKQKQQLLHNNVVQQYEICITTIFIVFNLYLSFVILKYMYM